MEPEFMNPSAKLKITTEEVVVPGERMVMESLPVGSQVGMGETMLAPPPPVPVMPMKGEKTFISETTTVRETPGFIETETTSIPSMLTTPVSTIPVSAGSMPVPVTTGLTETVGGLSRLGAINGLRIEQVLEPLTGLGVTGVSPTGIPTTTPHNYRFNMYDLNVLGDRLEPSVGQLLFYAIQGREFFTQEAKDAVGNSFEFQIFDSLDNSLVMVVTRPRSALTKYVKVYDPNRRYLGKVKKSLIGNKLSLTDPSKLELFSLKPPVSKAWTVLNILRSGEEIGAIHKRSTVATGEDTHTYDLIFPPGSDITSRALLLAATIFAEMLWGH